MVEELLKNIDMGIRMARELQGFIERYSSARPEERRMFSESIKVLQNRIRIINHSIPVLVSNPQDNSVLHQKIPEKKVKDDFIPRSRSQSAGDLNISEDLIKKLKKESKKEIKVEKMRTKPSFYGKISNKLFFGLSNTWVKRGRFKNLSLDLRRSNMNILTTTYVSMMFFSTLMALIFGFIIALFFMFFSFGIDFPYFGFYQGEIMARILQTFWIVFAVPLLTFVSFYFYPAAEKRSLEGKINQELPFVVIHMGSISGSGIEPIEIFKIIGLGDEYKYTKKEMMKIINQTNLYGYDLTTALRNVARATPSRRLSELLNGISITINSGGEIHKFFEKRAESLLLEYRLEREKYTKSAETFMDIYISIVIAAPMILLMLLIMIAVSGIGTGFSTTELSFGVIGIVVILNILFLTFLQLKQPSY